MMLCGVNVYINAHRSDNPHHDFYRSWLFTLMESKRTWAYCEFVLSAFVRIVTHPGIYKTPTPLEQALAFAESVRSHPRAIGLMPAARHWGIFRGLCAATNAGGNLVPDAYLAALAIESGAEWVTADRNFKRFPGLNCTLLRPV